MKRSRSRSLVHRILLLVLGLGALTTLAACGRKIGDDCLLGTDCSPNGDRTCDLSQPGGYCTVEGCDDHSCPDESICVRFFPIEFVTLGCDVGAAVGDALACTDPNDVCIGCKSPDDGTVCPAGAGMPGLCASRASERRLCVKSCGGNGDCRSGYECRAGGTHGAIPLLTNTAGTAQFCVPNAT